MITNKTGRQFLNEKLARERRRVSREHQMRETAEIEWIKVSDKMPPASEIVIVASVSSETSWVHTGIAWRFPDGGWNTRQSGLDLSGIEYWASIPLPPNALMESVKSSLKANKKVETMGFEKVKLVTGLNPFGRGVHATVVDICFVEKEKAFHGRTESGEKYLFWNVSREGETRHYRRIDA